ncbi:MAG: hypothetical protein EBZ49_06840 [Proteobacteria bacterium]|nr:hypothetical protein [Pseudomonadota bacterium]
MRGVTHDDRKHIDNIVLEIRKRMRSGMTRDQIVNLLNDRIPSDLLFLCYCSAAIIERDYGRRIP